MKKLLPVIGMLAFMLITLGGCSSAGEGVHFAVEKPDDVRDAGGDELGGFHSDIQHTWEGFLTGDLEYAR